MFISGESFNLPEHSYGVTSLLSVFLLPTFATMFLRLSDSCQSSAGIFKSCTEDDVDFYPVVTVAKYVEGVWAFLLQTFVMDIAPSLLGILGALLVVLFSLVLTVLRFLTRRESRKKNQVRDFNMGDCNDIELYPVCIDK